MARIRRLALLLCAAAPLLAAAAATDRELENIKKKIEQERRDLSSLGVKESTTVKSLDKIQREIDKRNREIKQASVKISSLTSELREKQSRAEELAESAAARLALLEKRAAAVYRWQRAGTPLMVLDGDISLKDVMQRQRYLAAALRYDRELLNHLHRDKEEQHVLQQDLAQRQAELSEQTRLVGAAREEMRREAQKQQLLLTSLRREKETRLRTLRQMEAAAQRLEKMLDEIARRARGRPRDPRSPVTPGSGLAGARGRLEWPVAGTVSAPFGKFNHPEFATEIMRKGIEIETSPGAPVKAVEKGSVVYADPFAGYGKMVIVDHGERYYTIYGNLGEIHKKKGDGVARGEALGQAGLGASSAHARVYFEMRKDGQSFDPLPWLGKR